MPKYSQGSPNRYPNQSFIAVFDTKAEVVASKAAPGAMVFAKDIGSDGGLMVYNGTDWKQIEFDALP